MSNYIIRCSWPVIRFWTCPEYVQCESCRVRVKPGELGGCAVYPEEAERHRRGVNLKNTPTPEGEG